MTEQSTELAWSGIARQVAASIAPAWPLDQSVAVNPGGNSATKILRRLSRNKP
ncbi:hypothetical protein ABC733_11380 [Mangrovibacter sp. SLW1]